MSESTHHLVGITVVYTDGSKASVSVILPGSSSDILLKKAYCLAKSQASRPVEDIVVCDLGPASAPSGGYRFTDLGL